MTTLRTSPATSRSQAPGRDDRVLSTAMEGHERRPRERLHQLFERQCDWLREQGDAEHLAVDAQGATLSYTELDERANQLARHLLSRGARPGSRVALLLDAPVLSYVAMLAVLKVHAAYVPLDVGFPAERISYIAADAGFDLVVSTSSARDRVDGLGGLGVGWVWLDTQAAEIEHHPRSRLTEAERGPTVDQLAYIIYTSGSTGRPKGVAVDQASICNFVRVAARVYGIRPTDRMYQGLTIAFDFSFEEIWVPWLCGATLVPKPPGATLLGPDLHEFLTGRRVTAMCCVPTLLATIEEDLPLLRFLLVSGEACPKDLVTRWHRPGRRFLNVYGPTEATVTATWTELHPNKPVTIGVPLPSYSIVILDPDNPRRALPRGEVGEIGIAGIGLAREYLNRPEQTEKAFIADFLGLPDNPSGRIYRTGDMGRVNTDGEVEYQGRIDRQVKISGYRIELTEVESELLRVPGVAAAVVDTYSPVPGSTELVGYYSLRRDVEPPERDEIDARLRERLPAYMVPAYLEHLAAIPMTTSDKVDRKRLPAPNGRQAGGERVAPVGAVEQGLAEALAATLGIAQPSVTSDFFTDLGASSMVLAQFAARVRRRDELPSVSIRQLYQHRSIRALAQAVGGGKTGGEAGEAAGTPGEARLAATVVRVSGVGYLLCGVAQLLSAVAFLLLGGFVLDTGFQWLAAAPDLAGLCGRSAVFVVAVFVGWVLLPVVAKWLLVGRWKPTEFPLWGARYFRFWVVRTLVRLNPMALFVGSPLYLWYLRALGAKIGKDVAVFSRIVPVVTDLLTVEDGTVIRRGCAFTGYRAIRGRLQTGPVTLGRDVVVGDRTVLDIGTAMSDGAQLGHGSSLSSGQRVPAGQSWHGTPARPAGQVDYRGVAAARCGVLRKIAFSLFQLAATAVAGTVVVTAAILVLTRIPPVYALLDRGQRLLGTGTLYLVVLVVAATVFLGALLLAVAIMATLARLPRPLVRPGRAYPLYGVRYLAQQLIGRLTNSALLVLLLGDSSFIVPFLRALGYQLIPLVQTGSNFGTQHTHDSPYLTTVGTGTMISDGLSVFNMQLSNTSFQVDRAVIGGRNFLGNDIAFPAAAKTGFDVLLATKVMVPIHGPVREHVGLLGSPPFEIPRATSARDQFGVLRDPVEISRRLVRKNWYNAATLAAALASRCLRFVLVVQIAVTALAFYQQQRILAITAALLAALLVTTGYGVLMERASMGFRRLRPRECSIYDRYFWSHERLWKFYTNPLLTGTPLRSLLLRLGGVRLGRRVFDDGCVIPEKTLVTIGEDAVLNAGTVIQCHALEEGGFHSDRVTIGAGTTLGVAAFVHLGASTGQGAVLDADTFLMKGEQVGAHTVWAGNPAEDRPDLAAALTAPLPAPLAAPAGRPDGGR